jgi:hypothetical protein
MHILLKTGIIASALFSAASSFAQSGANYVESYIIGFSPVNLNPFETGFGLSGEYRVHSRVGLLLGLDYITLGADRQDAQSANGMRIYPEIRFYLPTPRANPRPAAEMYVGLAFLFKHVNTELSEWRSIQTASGQYYQQLFEYNAINNAFAPMLKVGFQFMIGARRNLVFGLEMGVGPSFNNIQIKNGTAPPEGLVRKDYLFFDFSEFSYNKKAGTSLEPIFGFHIGYHFGGK